MNKNNCQCHKEPCICGTGLCYNRNSTQSTIIENIDENGNIHYVESIYQKISLKDFENIERCCVRQELENSSIAPSSPDNENLESRGDSNLHPEIKEETEQKESIDDCKECCEHIYSTPLTGEKIHDCKDECNITAELYCQIKRVNAEPGETFSECSTSSSSDDESDESEDEIVGEETTEYVSAQGRTEDNSEATLEDEDSFNPSLVPYSSLNDGMENRIYCQHKSCCTLDPQSKCKHIRLESSTHDGQSTRNEDKYYNICEYVEGDLSMQTNEIEIEEMSNKTLEVFNENTSNEVKWTTIEPKVSRTKKTKQKRPYQYQTGKTNEEAAAAEYTESEEFTNIKPSTNSLNLTQINSQRISDESNWMTIEPEYQYQAYDTNGKTDLENNPDDPTWTTLLMENNERFSGQSWKRQKLSTEQTENEVFESNQSGSKTKILKHVTIPETTINSFTSEIKCIVNNRKRKYGSEQMVFPETMVHFDATSLAGDDFPNREFRRTFGGRRRRITIADFVPEDQLKTENLVSDKIILDTPKPVHKDAEFVLNKPSLSQENQPLWKSYVPCERSDFCIFPVDPTITKLRKVADTENKPASNTARVRDPRESFMKKPTVPFKPTKFLCFKYLPNISQKTSSTDTMQNNLIDQIAVDPPDFSPISADIPRIKTQGSRIPVLQSYKIRGKQSIESDIIRSSSFEEERRTTIGVDELRNVMVRKSNVFRQMIPPEARKSLFRKKSLSRKNSVPTDTFMGASTSTMPFDNEIKEERKSMSQGKQVTIVEQSFGSDSSLRSKMEKYYSAAGITSVTESSTSVKNFGEPTNVRQKQEDIEKVGKSKGTKKKVKLPLSAGEISSNRSNENSNKILQKTCCSQTGIHVCIKESLVSAEGTEESTIIQMVNIDVTPKNSNIVKVNVMPTVPEINKEGIITIPVQLRLCSELCKKQEIQEESVGMCTSTPNNSREELLYIETPGNNSYEHYMEGTIREETENVSPQNIQEEPYVNFLWNKMKNTLSESTKQDNQNVEIQTDLTLGQKLLSKSLNSLASKDSASSVQNKSEPVQKSGIDWNDILLPPPGSFSIKKVPMKKSKRRFSPDSTKQRDNNIVPSTSGGLPPTEELKIRKEPKESFYSMNKLKCCCSFKKSQEEPYEPTNNKTPDKQTTKEELSSSEDEPKSIRSNIISLVFSESYYEANNYPKPLGQTQDEEEKLLSPCTSKPEIPWTSILLPVKPQIKKIEKLDTSKTSTSITDQTLTDEYNSASRSPKTTDTCPNLSEDSHSCECKNFNDKGTNTSTEDCEAEPCQRKSEPTSDMSTYSTDIMKSFKEDPVLSAFKAFEEELKPVRKALAEVQSKLRALNIPELECIFKKDPISEYAISRSNSQIEKEYRPYVSIWPSDTRRTPTCTRTPVVYKRTPSRCFRQKPSEIIDHHRRHPYEFRTYRFATPPISAHSRNLSTDIWKAFGSCDRNTIKDPHEIFWKPLYPQNTRNCYNSFPSTRYESRNSTPESDLHYLSFDPSGTRYNEKTSDLYFPNVFEKKVEVGIEDYDLDYPESYKNTPTSSHAYSQQDCHCNSEYSLHSNATERLNSNHYLSSLPPKYISSFHTPSGESSNRYIPAKVRPITHYFVPNKESRELQLQNPIHSSTRNTSINLKNGVVSARTKIELPKVSHKNRHGNSTQKSVRKIYPQERNHYSQSEYDAFKHNMQPNDCTFEYSSVDDNSPIYSNCYKEYLKKERYT